jgi:hypothetical protein
MTRTIIAAVLFCLMNPVLSQPIRIHPENPHYFEYKGKAVVLITSGMHYGAVLNLDMDYDRYLAVLENNGFNLHREFIIPCYEWQNDENWEKVQTPLCPRPGKLLSPYARSGIPGAKDGLNKFDLDQWNPVYFDHLRDFCRKADEKNIVTEIVLFTVLYGEDTWDTNPLNAKNNINGIGNGHYNDYTFTRESKLLERQKELAGKIVKELNEFDNVYFEICNEPYWAKGIPGVNPEVSAQHFLPEVNAWQAEIAATVFETEKNLPKKHLVAQNMANEYYKVDTVCRPGVSVLNFHYAFPPKAVPDNYHCNLPVSFDETADGCDAPDRRTEAWAFMLSGGAVYDNLDWSFAIDDQSGRGRNPAGKRRSGLEVKQQLALLKHFMDDFDFIHAKPMEAQRMMNIPETVLYYGLENPQELAVYFLKRSVTAIRQAGLLVPPGSYELTWMDPLDGSIIRKQQAFTVENKLPLDFPPFSDDLVLKLKRTHQ